MYATDRQTSDAHHRLMPPYNLGGIIILSVATPTFYEERRSERKRYQRKAGSTNNLRCLSKWLHEPSARANPVAVWPNAFVKSRGRHEDAAFVDHRLLLLLLLLPS